MRCKWIALSSIRCAIDRSLICIIIQLKFVGYFKLKFANGNSIRWPRSVELLRWKTFTKVKMTGVTASIWKWRSRWTSLVSGTPKTVAESPEPPCDSGRDTRSRIRRRIFFLRVSTKLHRSNRVVTSTKANCCSLVFCSRLRLSKPPSEGIYRFTKGFHFNMQINDAFYSRLGRQGQQVCLNVPIWSQIVLFWVMTLSLCLFS